MASNSDVWALNLYRVYEGHTRGTLLRAHAKGPCNYPRKGTPVALLCNLSEYDADLMRDFCPIIRLCPRRILSTYITYPNQNSNSHYRNPTFYYAGT